MNKAVKEEQDAKDQIKEVESLNNTLNEQINDAKFEMTQNASDKTYQNTKMKKDKSEVQKNIDQGNQKQA